MRRWACAHHNYQGRRSDEAPDEVGVQAEPAAVGREVEVRAGPDRGPEPEQESRPSEANKQARLKIAAERGQG